MLTTFFSLGTPDVSVMLGYAGDLVSDLSPIWIAIVGVGLALIVVTAVIQAIRGH
jgi:hypothetical protein